MNAVRIAAWNSGTLPIYEPGLDEVVRGGTGRNLAFSTDVAAGINKADIIFRKCQYPDQDLWGWRRPGG